MAFSSIAKGPILNVIISVAFRNELLPRHSKS